jgi:hypothetical protein
MSMVEQQGNDLERDIVAGLRELPTEKQREVLDFVEFLHARSTPRTPRLLLKNLWSDVRVDDDALVEVREEMWRGFPRDDS